MSWRLGPVGGTALGIKRIRVFSAPQNVEELDFSCVGEGAAVAKPQFYHVEPKTLNRVMNATTTNGETDTAQWMKAGSESK